MSKGKVLVIDDDRVFLKIIERQLKNLEFEVFTATEGDEQIKELLASHSFVLALVDFYLGNEKGIDLVKRIPRLSDLPVVFISASDEQSVLDEILAVAPEGFIDKNRINPRELRATLDLIIYKRQKDEELRELNENLDRKVKDRTEKLDAAIKALVREMTAKEEAHQKMEEALQAEKEFGALKSNMISNLSHEFKTPLSSIKSSAQLIKKMLELASETDEKLFKHTHRIMDGANQLNNLLNRILLVEKSEVLEVNKRSMEMDIQPLFQSISEKFESGAAEEPELIIEEKYEVERFMIDPRLLELILTNLVSNALKFTINNEPVKLTFQTIADQNVIRIVVEDKGIGISKKDLEQIYYRFFRGQNVESIEGTGIGMSIVKRAIDSLGGDIDIKSKVNQGTTIEVKVPFELA